MSFLPVLVKAKQKCKCKQQIVHKAKIAQHFLFSWGKGFDLLRIECLPIYSRGKSYFVSRWGISLKSF